MLFFQRLARAAGFVLAVCVALAGGTVLLCQLVNGPAAHADAPAKPAPPPPIVLTLKTTGDGAKIEHIEISEGKDDRVTVYALPTLGRYLKRIRADKTASDTVVIKAGKDTKYSTVVSALEQCQAAGFRNVRMETEQPSLTVNLTGNVQITESVVLGGLKTLSGTELKLGPVETYGMVRTTRLVPLTTDQVVPVELAGSQVQYDKIKADYTKNLQATKNVEQLQRDWMRELQKFIEANPAASETADAFLQLGLMCEFTGKPAEARTWYERLLKQFPTAREAVKARGSAKRLQSVGQPFELDATRLDGKRFRISDLKGKIVVVYYWASWNHSSRGDLAQLRGLLNGYGQRGLEVVCVNLDEKLADAMKIFQHLPLDVFTQLREDGGLDSRLANDYGISVLPTLFLLDRDGKVVSNSVTPTGLEDEVKKLIK